MAISKDDMMARLNEERDLLSVERERLFRLAAKIQATAAKVDQRMMDTIAAGRLFDIPVIVPDWGRISRGVTLEEEMSRLLGEGKWERPEVNIESDDEEFLKAILEENPDQDERESRPAGMPSIREIVLERLKLAGDAGSKASAICEYIENTYAAEIHVKTVGMTLYRLVKEGLARRDGRIWFRVVSPSGADAKNDKGVEPKEN